MKQIKDIAFSEIQLVNPVGEDAKVQALQIHLMAQVPWLKLAFGLAYRNPTKKGDYIPEVYFGNNEYLEVLPDDQANFCFFDMPETAVFNQALQKYKTKINIIFNVDLSRAYPNITHRAAREAIQSVENVINSYYHGWELTGYKRGVQNVYSNYNFKITDALIDMHPKFIFSIETELVYNLKC